MKKLIIVFSILSLDFNLFAQNVGINNTDPQAALDVQGDVRLRSAILTLPASLNHNVDLLTTKSSVYMFAGGALDGCQITGFTGGVDGRIVTIFNNSTTAAVQLYDASDAISIANSAAENRIYTGTGNSAVIFQNGSVTFRYDGAKQRWTVIGSNYVEGLSTVAATQWNVIGDNISNNNIGNVGIGTETPLQKLDVGGASILANSTIIDPDAYANRVVAGRIVDGSGFDVLSGIGGNASTNPLFQGRSWAMGHNGTNFYIGSGTGISNTIQTGIQINTNRNVVLVPISGNVGIGEEIPSEKLQINNGNAKIGKSLWASVIDNKVLKFGDGDYVTIGEVNGDDKMEINANEITIKANSGNVLFPTGNVGIGNNTPVAPLSFANVFGNRISLWTNSPTSQYGIGIQGGTFQFYTAGADKMAFGYGSSNNFTETMSFFPGSGQLGIGTLNLGGYKLAVNGSIRSKEVVVETGWADFVFDEKYKLPLLSDVEKFIKENKHLPNIPSAEEIQTNGLKVGEVQTKMMQKIEELTLYIIELKKEIDALKLIADLKNK